MFWNFFKEYTTLMSLGVLHIFDTPDGLFSSCFMDTLANCFRSFTGLPSLSMHLGYHTLNVDPNLQAILCEHSFVM